MGEKIKNFRIKLGLSQTDLANKLFVTRQAVSKWELGKATPDIDLLKKLSEIFQCKIDDLLENDNVGFVVNDNTIKINQLSRMQKIVIILMSLILLVSFSLAISLPLVLAPPTGSSTGNNPQRACEVVGVYMEINGDGRFQENELLEKRRDNAYVKFDPKLNWFEVESHNFELFTSMDGNFTGDNFLSGKAWCEVYGTVKFGEVADAKYLDYWEIRYKDGAYFDRFAGTRLFRNTESLGCIIVQDKDKTNNGSYFYIKYYS